MLTLIGFFATLAVLSGESDYVQVRVDSRGAGFVLAPVEKVYLRPNWSEMQVQSAERARLSAFRSGLAELRADYGKGVGASTEEWGREIDLALRAGDPDVLDQKMRRVVGLWPLMEAFLDTVGEAEVARLARYRVYSTQARGDEVGWRFSPVELPEMKGLAAALTKLEGEWWEVFPATAYALGLVSAMGEGVDEYRVFAAPRRGHIWLTFSLWRGGEEVGSQTWRVGLSGLEQGLIDGAELVRRWSGSAGWGAWGRVDWGSWPFARLAGDGLRAEELRDLRAEVERVLGRYFGESVSAGVRSVGIAEQDLMDVLRAAGQGVGWRGTLEELDRRGRLVRGRSVDGGEVWMAPEFLRGGEGAGVRRETLGMALSAGVFGSGEAEGLGLPIHENVGVYVGLEEGGGSEGGSGLLNALAGVGAFSENGSNLLPNTRWFLGTLGEAGLRRLFQSGVLEIPSLSGRQAEELVEALEFERAGRGLMAPAKVGLRGRRALARYGEMDVRWVRVVYRWEVLESEAEGIGNGLSAWPDVDFGSLEVWTTAGRSRVLEVEVETGHVSRFRVGRVEAGDWVLSEGLARVGVLEEIREVYERMRRGEAARVAAARRFVRP